MSDLCGDDPGHSSLSEVRQQFYYIFHLLQYLSWREQYNGTHHLLLEQYRPGVLKANSAFNTDIMINIQDQLIVLISFLVVKASLEIVT